MRVSLILLWAGCLVVIAWLVINGQSVSWPVGGVDIEKTGQYIAEGDIVAVVDPLLEDAWLSLDINAIQAKIAAMPWVERVQVYRIFPDRLRLKIEEKVPVARYHDSALISKTGKCFEPNSVVEVANLPELSVDYKDLAIGYEGLMRTQALLAQHAALPQDVAVVSYQVDKGWDVRFHTGMLVRLGHGAIDKSLEKWAHYYPKILQHKKGVQPKKIDMRYANGAAVS